MTLKKDTKTNKAKLLEKRAELAAQGINLREHCAAHNIDYQAARDLLCGKCKGRRGKAHHAAVFLGLKPNPAQQAA
jgi:gp16 family phage-associated protein